MDSVNNLRRSSNQVWQVSQAVTRNDDAYHVRVLHEHRPDIIVELTNACDKRCPGCYAPNLLVRSDRIRASNAQLLTPTLLDKALTELSEKGVIIAGGTASFRGGEPSLCPVLAGLVRVAASARLDIIMETHGLWLLRDDERKLEILSACKEFNVTIKA